MPVPQSRFAWVDNLRTLLIIFVVNMHACVTYSHVGGWYFMEGTDPSTGVKLPFLLWEAHLQAFFMGLLFFFAGYFAEISAQRKDTWTFMKERLWRLGIPVLLYVFVIHPFMVWGINPWEAKFPPLGHWYLQYLRSGDFVGMTGPLWFAEALLIFCIVFMLWRGRWGQTRDEASTKCAVSVRTSAVLCLMVCLGLASFLIRLVQSIGVSVLNLQFCFFAQYLTAFPLGVWLARRRALNDVASASVARRVGGFTLMASPLILFALLKAMPDSSWHGPPPEIFGGMNLLALGYAFWEQFAAVGISFGLMAFAFARMNRETAFSRWAAERSFAVYVVHSPILLALTTGLHGLSSNPFLMAGLATIGAVSLSFLAADVIKRVPGLNRIF